VISIEYYSFFIVGTYNAHKHPNQRKLIEGLSHMDIIVVAMRTPYDLMSFTEVPCCLATYGTRCVSTGALSRVLLGLEKPRGMLPVDMPSLYPINQGLTDFLTVDSLFTI
jgi:beta-N-acetylhexosaminidase